MTENKQVLNLNFECECDFISQFTKCVLLRMRNEHRPVQSMTGSVALCHISIYPNKNVINNLYSVYINISVNSIESKWYAMYHFEDRAKKDEA